MKKTMVVFAIVMLFGVFAGINTAAAAFNLGKIGQAVKKTTSETAAAVQPRDSGVPTQQQAQSDPDYVKIRTSFYKKSSVEVLSKDKNNSKIKATIVEFLGGRVMITDYLFECTLNTEKKRVMQQTMLGARTYDESTGKQTSTTESGGKGRSLSSMEPGILSGILYKQATGQEPPAF